MLKRGKDDGVSWSAAENPNCPPEALSDVLKRGNDDYVSRLAAENPHCPPETLSEVLKRGKDDYVSCDAARNPNCPKKYHKIYTLRIFLKENGFSKKEMKNILQSFEKK